MRTSLRRTSTTRMSKFVPVALVSEIPVGTARPYIVGDREVAVFNVDGTFYAIENGCPHQGGPLAEGWIEGNVVTCPWHAWCFDVTDGKMTLGGFTSVDAFDVQVEGSTINVSSEPRV
jgi:nitrite reductase (NADH) small subunit